VNIRSLIPSRLRVAKLAISSLVLPALALSACGSSEPPGTTPTKWAQQYCGAMVSWIASTQSATSQLNTQVSTATDPTTVKSDVLSHLAARLSAVDTLIAQIDKAGTPAITDGPKISKSLNVDLQSYRSVIVASQGQLGAVSPTSSTNLYNSLNSIGNNIDSSETALGNKLTALGKTFNATGDQPLVTAMNSSKSCKQLSSQGLASPQG